MPKAKIEIVRAENIISEKQIEQTTADGSADLLVLIASHENKKVGHICNTITCAIVKKEGSRMNFRVCSDCGNISVSAEGRWKIAVNGVAIEPGDIGDPGAGPGPFLQ